MLATHRIYVKESGARGYKESKAVVYLAVEREFLLAVLVLDRNVALPLVLLNEDFNTNG